MSDVPPLPSLEADHARPLPWLERDRSLVWRVSWTLAHASFRPLRTFATAHELRLTDALRLSILGTVLGYAPLGILLPCLAVIPFSLGLVRELAPDVAARLGALGPGLVCAGLSLAPLALVLATLAFDGLAALALILVTRVLGGRLTSGAAARGALLLGLTRAWLAIPLCVAWIPGIGTLTQALARLALIAWSALPLAAIAHASGLSWTRSVAVGICVPIALGAFVALGALGIAALASAVLGGSVLTR